MLNFLKYTGLSSIFTLLSATLSFADGVSYRTDFFSGYAGGDLKVATGLEAAMSAPSLVDVVVADSVGYHAGFFSGYAGGDLKAATGLEAAMSASGVVDVVVAGALNAESAQRLLQGRDQYFGEMAAVQVMDAASIEVWSASHSTSEIVNLEDLTWQVSELSSQDALAILNGRDRYLN